MNAPVETQGFLMGGDAMKLTHDNIREILDYDPITGVLTWKERGLHWFENYRYPEALQQNWNTRFKGKRAGSVNKGPSGYLRRQISIMGGVYKEHRIIWLWMTGKFPENVDHIDQDATNNKWSNLRETSREENQKNMSLNRNNTSGFCGVSKSRNGKWVARVVHKRKNYYLGTFDEIDEAAMEVLEFRADHGFHRDHGRDLAHYHKESV